MNRAKAKATVRAQIESAVRAILHEKVEDLTAPSEGRFTSRFRQVTENLLREGDPRVQLATLELLMAYGYGKPVQPTESKVETTQTFIAEIPPIENTEDWLLHHGRAAVLPDPLTDN